MARNKGHNKKRKQLVQKDQQHQHNQSQARSESFDICNFAYFFYDKYPDSIARMVAAGKAVDMHVSKGLNDAIKAYRPTSDGRLSSAAVSPAAYRHICWQRKGLRCCSSKEATL